MASRWSSSSITAACIAAFLYLAWTVFLVGFRQDHGIFLIFLVSLYFATEETHRWVKAFIFIILYWVIYDGMRVYPNYLVNPIHIAEPYEWEKAWFGLNHAGNILTPNEWLGHYLSPILTFLSGFFYLTWVPLPILFAIYLYRKDKYMMLQFTASFLFTNLVGFVIYYMYPAAPPWYVEAHGFTENFEIPGSAARLELFDELIHAPVFTNMYTKNANVFAAIPSLHAAYPIVLTYYGFKSGLKRMKWIFAVTIAGIWFGAVYSNHHYIIDLLLGAFCAIFAIFAFEKIVLASGFKEILKRYARQLNR